MKPSTLLWLSPSLAYAVDIYDSHYPPEVPTFNPAEFYKNVDRPTITAYRACDKPRSISGLSIGTCDSTWIAHQTMPVRFGDGYIDVQQNMFEKLTWTGANKDYPLVIGFETTPRPTYRMERGKSCPPNHNPNPISTCPNSAMTEYPGSLLDVDVNISEMVKHFNFTTDNFPNKTTDAAMATFVRGIGATMRFTVGQPQDPRWKDDAATKNGTIVDAGTAFYLPPSMSVKNLAQDRDTIARNKWEDKEQKWRLGVGIGVGIGVPVLLIAAFIAGRATGLKNKTEMPGKATA